MKKRKDPKAPMDPRKSALLKSLAGSLLLIALGVLLLLRPDFATATVASVLGWILIGGGAILIAVTLLNWNVMGVTELMVGVAAAAAGIFIVIRPDFLASAFGIIIGIYLAIHGLAAIANSLTMKKLGKNFLPLLIMGLLMLVLALVLFFVPMSLSRLLVRIVGGLIILVGLANLVLRSKFFLSLPQKKIVDAREDN